MLRSETRKSSCARKDAFVAEYASFGAALDSGEESSMVDDGGEGRKTRDSGVVKVDCCVASEVESDSSVASAERRARCARKWRCSVDAAVSDSGVGAGAEIGRASCRERVS